MNFKYKSCRKTFKQQESSSRILTILNTTRVEMFNVAYNLIRRGQRNSPTKYFICKGENASSLSVAIETV